MWADDTTSCFEINICRLCANKSEVIIPIFSKEADKERVDLKIRKFLPIVIREDDLKPKYVCFTCIQKLEVCNELFELSLVADSKFDSLLQSRHLSERDTDLEAPAESSEVQDTSENPKSGSFLETILPSGIRTWPEDLAKHPELQNNNGNLPVLTSEEGSGVIVLSKRDTKSIMRSAEDETQVPQDIVFMVELKYKDDDQNTLTKSHAVSYVVDPPDAHKNSTFSLDNNKTLSRNFLSELSPTKAHNVAYAIEDRSQVFSLTYSTNAPSSSSVKSNSIFTDNELIKHPRMIYTETYLNADERSDVVLKTSETESNIDIDNALIFKRTMKEVDGNDSEIIVKSEKPFPCDLCEKSYMRRANLKAHMSVHTQVRPHLCNQCGARFVLRWDLTLHLRIHSNTFACAFCSKAFTVRNKLERHIRTHTGERPFACATCGKAFSDKRNLASHEKTHSSERPYVCPICGRSFRISAHLRDHRRVHSEIAAFTCDICGKNFKWKTNLNIHLKVHTGVRIPCDECGREFSRRADLKKHERSHNGERSHVCGVCNKSYMDKAILQKHLKMHNQLKPYTCDICNKSFHFQWYLNSHKKTHRTVKTFPCERCNRVFMKKGNLTIHLKQHDDDANQSVDSLIELAQVEPGTLD